MRFTLTVTNKDFEGIKENETFFIEFMHGLVNEVYHTVIGVPSIGLAEDRSSR